MGAEKEVELDPTVVWARERRNASEGARARKASIEEVGKICTRRVKEPTQAAQDSWDNLGEQSNDANHQNIECLKRK